MIPFNHYMVKKVSSLKIIKNNCYQRVFQESKHFKILIHLKMLRNKNLKILQTLTEAKKNSDYIHKKGVNQHLMKALYHF